MTRVNCGFRVALVQCCDSGRKPGTGVTGAGLRYWMVSAHAARAKPIRPGREVRAEHELELPKLRGGPPTAAQVGDSPGPPRYSQPSCPALPSAQTDGTLLGPAGRHVRRLSESHQYKRGERPSPLPRTHCALTSRIVLSALSRRPASVTPTEFGAPVSQWPLIASAPKYHSKKFRRSPPLVHLPKVP